MTLRIFLLIFAASTALTLAGCGEKPASVGTVNPPVTPVNEPGPQVAQPSEAEPKPAEPVTEPTPAGDPPAVALVQATTDSKPEEPVKKPALFDGWPKPQYVLVFSGQQQGYIEPCGCTGLANQKGGLMRRETFLAQLREKGWDVVPMDLGNQVRQNNKQQEIKFETTLKGLLKMKYGAVVPGIDDLKLPTLELFRITNEATPNIFVCANVALLDRAQTPEFRIIEAGGKKIGVTGVLGDSFRVKLQNNDELVHQPAEEGLKAVTAKLVAEKCDLLVLLAHTTLDETAALAKKFPQYQLIATAAGVGEPPLGLENIPDAKPKQVQVGSKAMYLMVVGVFDDPKEPFRAQRVPLDDRYGDAEPMVQLMGDYQEQLKALGFEGLGLKPQPHPSEQSFVGSEKCGECHTKAFAVWKDTPHAHATDAIVKPPERTSIARHFDPECISCHVTGWEPQRMYPFATGYLSLEKTPKMKHNGCENCHGPGSRHVAVESGEMPADEKKTAALRQQMKLKLVGEEAKRKCTECHDIDNSPDFHEPGAFEKYWKKVEHHGKD